MNKVILTGNVSRTPRTYVTHHGKEYTTFFVETTDSWKDETGEWHSATDRHRVSVFRESTMRWIKDVLKCGDPVSVEGKLTYQHWTDKFNQSRFTPHVVITKTEGKVEHFLCDSTKNRNQSSKLNSNQNLADSISEQEVISSGSDHENEDAAFELSQEQIHPEPMHPNK